MNGEGQHDLVICQGSWFLGSSCTKLGYLGHTLALTSLELQLPHRSEGDWHTNFLTLSSLLKRKKVKMCCVRPEELIVLIARKQQGPFERLFSLGN